jgi:hypothetical protein
MFKKKISSLLTLTFIATLLITACGENVDSEAIIQTSVAETVAAQPPVVITETPAATQFPTQTPFAQATLGTPIALVSPTSAPITGSNAECAKASLQDESVVDGKIFKPGEQFTKTWYITNDSTCIWNTTYKIVFWDGDILGGGYVYQLPQVVGPGQTIPVSLVLTAPTTEGTYRSEWKLQTPDNVNFGVGFYQTAFYTEIVVSAEEKPTYTVTSANMVIDREPKFGCQPANISYWAIVTLTSNGPLKIKYRILHSDGGHGSIKTLEFKEAEKIVLSDHRWLVGRANTQNANRWMQFVILEPYYKEYAQVGFEFFCP